LSLAAFVLFAVLAEVQVTSAQSDGDHTAAIHAGACGEIGEELVMLNAPQHESGDWLGIEGLAPILESDTEDISDVSGPGLTDEPHSIVMFSGETAVACGEIGGPVDDDDMIVSIHPVDESGYFGIADIDDILDDDDDDGVEVHLYVVQPAG
jgi:hypothetical protein